MSALRTSAAGSAFRVRRTGSGSATKCPHLANINGFNRPTNVRFSPDGCAYVVDHGAVRDLSSDSHFVGANNTLVQIPGTGVIWKICPM
jgi:hypothetical protein